MRVIRNAYVDDWERRSDEIRSFPSQFVTSAREGVMTFGEDEGSDPSRTCMPAGQGVGGIDAILPVSEIMDRLLRGARETIERLGRMI